MSVLTKKTNPEVLTEGHPAQVVLENPICCSQQSAKGLHKCVFFTIVLWSPLGFDLLRTKTGSSSLSLRVPLSYQTPLLSVNRYSQGTQNSNSWRRKIRISPHCYSPDFCLSQLQGHLSMFTIPTSLPLLTHCSQWAVCHLHYSNFCGQFCDEKENKGLLLLRKNIEKINKGIPPSTHIFIF